ncbi:MAG: hypothetical protein IJY92_03070 [Alphaproteobacteria bacterium]|nr:hypothetical protein [Alphaproteobacteria bacterium]
MTTSETNNNDKIIQIAQENLNLNRKQAEKFADQARALQKNLKLRKKQKEERLQKEQNQQ